MVLRQKVAQSSDSVKKLMAMSLPSSFDLNFNRTSWMNVFSYLFVSRLKILRALEWLFFIPFYFDFLFPRVARVIMKLSKSTSPS